MIVVGVRVTRISTDGCAVRVQFVVGLHSVPYLFNSNFYQLTLRASNDRVLFFLCPHISTGEPCTSRGKRMRRRKYLRCVITRCSYAAGVHGVVVLRGRAVGLRYCCAVSCRECYPQGLSTVWRTYTHVIWRSGAEARHGCHLRAQ